MVQRQTKQPYLSPPPPIPVSHSVSPAHGAHGGTSNGTAESGAPPIPVSNGVSPAHGEHGVASNGSASNGVAQHVPQPPAAAQPPAPVPPPAAAAQPAQDPFAVFQDNKKRNSFYHSFRESIPDRSAFQLCSLMGSDVINKFDSQDAFGPLKIATRAQYYRQQWDSLIEGLTLFVTYLDPASIKKTETLGDFLYHQHQAPFIQERAAIDDTDALRTLVDNLSRQLKLIYTSSSRRRLGDLLTGIHKVLKPLLTPQEDAIKITDIRPSYHWAPTAQHMQFEEPLKASLQQHLGANYTPPSAPQARNTATVKTRLSEAEGYLAKLLEQSAANPEWTNLSSQTQFQDSSEHERRFQPAKSVSCRYQALLTEEQNYQCKQLLKPMYRALETINNDIKAIGGQQDLTEFADEKLTLLVRIAELKESLLTQLDSINQQRIIWEFKAKTR